MELHLRLLATLLVLHYLVALLVNSISLPPIWDQMKLDDESETFGAYRILSEIHLDGKGSFMVEEWLDGAHQLFRMDVLPEHQDGDERFDTKKSFIVDGGTQERFFYEPFRCLNLKPDVLDKTLQQCGLSELFARFPRHSRSENSLVLGGLGSIWMEALNSKTQPVFRPAKTDMASSGRRRRTKFEVMRAFDKYTLEPSDKFPYQMEFYFVAQPPGDDGASSPGENPPLSLIAIHLIEPKSNTIKLTGRIIQIEVGLQSLGSNSMGTPRGGKGLFELPLGYGCSRRKPYKLGELDYKPPRNCFLSSRQPHTCHLEVDTWLPDDLSDDEIDLWRHHSSSMRLVTGRLLDHSYLTVEASDFAPVGEEPELNLDTLDFDETKNDAAAINNEQSPSQVGVLMRRVKRVWDLGRVDDKDVDETRRPTPMYFGLTNHLKKCETVGHAELNELPNIEFSLILPDGFDQQVSHSTGNVTASSEAGQRTTTRTLGLTLVDHAMMSELFEQLEGYKLVREASEPWLKYQTVQMERRVDQFEFRDRNGRVAWVGPVSLIREFHFMDTFSDHITSIEDGQAAPDSSRLEVPADALRVKLTIIPYTKRLDRQLGRIQLTMSPGLRVDEAYLHRELDIGPCLRASTSLAEGTIACSKMQQDWPQSGSALEASVDFKLIYPLEESLANEQIPGVRSRVYSEFLRQLTSESLLQAVGGHCLNPLQVTKLSVDIDPELVRITGTINKWPEMFNYIEHLSARPVVGTRLKVFLSELKPNVELCAQSCSHYECPVFVYSSLAKLCELFEWLHTHTRQPTKGQRQSTIDYTNDYQSNAYERKLESQPSASPILVLKQMQEVIHEELGDDDKLNELAIELDSGLVLVPSSLLVGNELWRQDELSLEGAKAMAHNDTSRPVQLELADGGSLLDKRPGIQIELEFAFFSKKRKFMQEKASNREEFPVAESNHLSKGECEQLCLENDCRSYSFCNFESTCIVSKLIRTEAIQAASEEEDFCFIMVLDHLSKFQATSKSIVDKETLTKTNQQSSSKMTMMEFESQRDCAHACLEFQDFTCRSFFYCPAAMGELADQQPGTSGNCFLSGSRQSAMLIGANSKQSGPGSSSSADSTAASDRFCDYYQRSYVVDYGQYHGKRLASPGTDSGNTIEILVGLGAEDCASECSRRAAGEDGQQQASFCRAFHVCFGNTGGGGGDGSGINPSGAVSSRGKRQQLLCGLLAEDPSRPPPPASNGSALTKDLLVAGSKCTAFIRLGRGGGGGSVISDEPEPYGLGPIPADKQTKWGFFMADVITILLGISVGYLLSWLVALVLIKLDVLTFHPRR